MPKRSRFRGKTVDDIQWKLMNDYPAGSKIVAAEKVTEGGILGYFATQYYEVTVQVPDPARPAGIGSQPAPPANGVAALLIEADMEEARLQKGSVPKMSTESPAFDELIKGLAVTQAPPVKELLEISAGVPTMLTTAGSVVLVVGIGQDALTAARSLGTITGSAEIRTAGSAMMGGFVHVVSKQGLAEARAAGIRSGRVVIIAFGIGHDGAVRAPALSELTADQVWLAVDATRKASDTAAWVRKVIWVTAPDALAVLRASDTLTPQSVNELNVPVGWVDGIPAHAPILH